MSRRRLLTGCAGLAAILWLGGCATLQEAYPRFKEQSASMKSVAVTIDLVVLEDVRGPLPLIDIPRMAALAGTLNEHFRAEFEKRGISVAHTEHAATGLRYSFGNPPAFKIRPDLDASDKPLEQLGTGEAPYWLSDVYADPARRGQLVNALEDLKRKEIKSGMANLVSSPGRQLGAKNGETHRVFVLVEGVQVPMGKGLMQAMATGLLSLGTVSVFEMTTVGFRVGIMDVATGEFIFIDDCTLAGGWTVDAAYLRRQAGVFFAHLDRLRAK